MPKPMKQRETDNPIGKKFHAVMAEKLMVGDYRALAKDFKVSTPSVYDWIDHGRISKERYPRLVEWSGRSLDWWFDVPAVAGDADHFLGVQERPRDYVLNNEDSIEATLNRLRKLLRGHNEERRKTCADLLARLANDPGNDQISANLELNLQPEHDKTNKRFAT